MQIFTEQSVSYWSWRTLWFHGWRIYIGFPASSSTRSKMWEVPVLVQFPLQGCLVLQAVYPSQSFTSPLALWILQVDGNWPQSCLCAAASHWVNCVAKVQRSTLLGASPSIIELLVPFLASTESHNLFMFTYVFKQSVANSSVVSFT